MQPTQLWYIERFNLLNGLQRHDMEALARSIRAALDWPARSKSKAEHPGQRGTLWKKHLILKALLRK